MFGTKNSSSLLTGTQLNSNFINASSSTKQQTSCCKQQSKGGKENIEPKRMDYLLHSFFNNYPYA